MLYLMPELKLFPYPLPSFYLLDFQISLRQAEWHLWAEVITYPQITLMLFSSIKNIYIDCKHKLHLKLSTS